MLSDVSLAISSLTNRKTRDQIMILNSKRFLDKLVSTLEEKKHHKVKLKDGKKSIPAFCHLQVEYLIEEINFLLSTGLSA
ncbi:hypothetical protein CsSME_00037935 [Camellia sinensis var. sinensis]